ncbi:cobalamin biosynthesis protein [uncultured Devosia sp.]|uniref:cobalamin biosynthesis protein n=1 Tax=uncultured Devosia sp. TaxID=211434 RepID=UPI0035CB772F
MAEPAVASALFDVQIPVIAGVGCRRGAGAGEIIALLHEAMADAGPAYRLLAIATLDRKAGEPGLIAAADYFGVPLRALPADQLAGPEPAGSAKVLRLIGVPSVAEATARQAGPLILPKFKSAHATCALAALAPQFDLATFGQPAPVSTAAIAPSRSLTSTAGP